jgi:hypothetical protein
MNLASRLPGHRRIHIKCARHRDHRSVEAPGGFLSRLTNPASLPQWLSEADVDFYVSEFAGTGFRGGLNWYRNIDRNWKLFASVSGVQVTVPALYIAGDRDLVLAERRAQASTHSYASRGRL